MKKGNIRLPHFLYGFALLLLSGINVQAQDVEADFKAVGQTMQNQKLYFEMRYDVFDKNGKEQLESQVSQFYSWGPYSIFKYQETETYTNERFTAMVNNNRHLIVLNKTRKRAPVINKDMPDFSKLLAYDSTAFKQNKIELLEDLTDKRTYSLSFKGTRNSRYERMLLSFHPGTYRLQRVVLYFRQNMKNMIGEKVFSSELEGVIPRVEITYSNYRELKEEDLKLFSAPHILRVDRNGKVTLSDLYKKYELANYYNMTK